MREDADGFELMDIAIVSVSLIARIPMVVFSFILLFLKDRIEGFCRRVQAAWYRRKVMCYRLS